MAIIGIDKLNVTTFDFSVKDIKNQAFGIDTSIKQGGVKPPGLLRDASGQSVEAWKMFHNGIGNYTISPKGLLISFNPSKMFHPYHLISTDEEKYNEALATIDNEMKSIGIFTNLSEAKPCRIDLASQAEMVYPVHQYQDAFRLLQMQRTKNQRQYEGGFLYGNNSSQTIFYDKAKELRYNRLDAIMQGEKNFLRGEVRQLKTKAVASLFHINTLADFSLLSPDEINNTYKSFLNKRIFSRKYLSEQLAIDFNSEVEILRRYKQEHRANAWMQYIAEINLDTLLLKFGNIDSFCDLLRHAGYKDRQVYNIRNRIKEMINKKAGNDLKRGKVTASTLLMELQSKFAA